MFIKRKRIVDERKMVRNSGKAIILEFIQEKINYKNTHSKQNFIWVNSRKDLKNNDGKKKFDESLRKVYFPG